MVAVIYALSRGHRCVYEAGVQLSQYHIIDSLMTATAAGGVLGCSYRLLMKYNSSKLSSVEFGKTTKQVLRCNISPTN